MADSVEKWSLHLGYEKMNPLFYIFQLLITMILFVGFVPKDGRSRPQWTHWGGEEGRWNNQATLHAVEGAAEFNFKPGFQDWRN